MTAAARTLALGLVAAAQIALAPAANAQASAAPAAGTDAASAPARPTYTGEPLPAGAPTGEYELAAWCFGAMSEYLDVYDAVKPSLRDIDKQFGSSVPGEKEPYAADMAAARAELGVLAGAVTAAEKASPDPIAAKGAAEVTQGRSIWSLAEQKSRRELARAWLSWAMPDKCDSTARQLAAKSALLGQALKYNTGASTPDVDPGAPAPAAASTTPSDSGAAPAPPAEMPAAPPATDTGPPEAAPGATPGAAPEATPGATSPN